MNANKIMVNEHLNLAEKANIEKYSKKVPQTA